MTSSHSRAERLFDQVVAGKTIFFKAGDRTWDILGPAEAIQLGETVTVTKASGETEQVVVAEIMSERTVRGVATRSARFTRATRKPAATVTPEPATGGSNAIRNRRQSHPLGEYVRSEPGCTVYRDSSFGGGTVRIYDES